MRNPVNDKIYSLDEYIKGEWTSELRHEFIDGRLFEMVSEPCRNNEITGNISAILHRVLKKSGYQVYFIDIKLAIPNENKYYYPDVFATKEDRISGTNDYIKYEPEIIVEVVFESTHVTDYVYKQIDYSKIQSLQYYLTVEPETILINVHERGDGDKWTTRKYTQTDAVVTLPKLNLEFRVKQVYD